jgi:hypothetical protein
MDNLLSPKLTLIFAFLMAVAGACIWYVFLRPVPNKTTMGTIINKTFKPAGTYWQYPAGSNRGFRTPTPIPVAEADIFEIRVDGFEGAFFYPLNTVASRAYDVGTKVRITYQERGLPLIWKRVYVLEMSSK